MLLILKGICFAVLWFFAVGPAIWYGWMYWGPDVDQTPREGSVDDLGQQDRWRHRADMTDDEHEAALRAAWDDRQLPQ